MGYARRDIYVTKISFFEIDWYDTSNTTLDGMAKYEASLNYKYFCDKAREVSVKVHENPYDLSTTVTISGIVEDADYAHFLLIGKVNANT